MMLNGLAVEGLTLFDNIAGWHSLSIIQKRGGRSMGKILSGYFQNITFKTTVNNIE